MKALALVIGNNDYIGNSKLVNAVNDAHAISEIFTKLNYEVIYKQDCTSSDYADVLSKFEDKITNFDASIFYFAGHGFQFDGENYLASVECPVEKPNKHICERTCIRLTEITDIIKKAPTKINIIIIDACRKSFARGSSNSFTQINAPEGTIIAFSTSPGEGAQDGGMIGHSLYTGTLLKYIGRESLSVEELFKRTRKTAHNLSNGSQTSWEHTSLVGDFYFNTGQMVHSVAIPYKESVVKDRDFVSNGSDIDQIITDLKSCNWDKQNPAIIKLKTISPNTLDKNKQFIIGRNILQASGYAYNATNFIDDLEANLARYNSGGENHVLNGILYEVYFDNNGDFRKGNFKTPCIEKIFSFRRHNKFKKSFEFIGNVLAPYKSDLYYIPDKVDTTIDVDISARKHIKTNLTGKSEECQAIESIKVLGKDITKQIYPLCWSGGDSSDLKKALADFLIAPEELLNLNENILIKSFCFDN